MKLKDIIQHTDAIILHGTPDTEINAITSDSRKAGSGSLFLAVKGVDRDGHDYIDAALAAGATAVVSATRLDLALCADNFYGHPSRDLTLVGITGTNGKTTTVTLLYHLFRKLGYECGLLSTIANYVGDKRMETANTTSDPITINSLLAEMVRTPVLRGHLLQPHARPPGLPQDFRGILALQEALLRQPARGRLGHHQHR